MMSWRFTGVATGVLVLVLGMSGGTLSVAADKLEKKDIVDTAVAAGNFKTLVTAVKAAGLVDTLKGDGPFTVFAPTDEAFGELPDGTVETLLKPVNKTLLTQLLSYHVVPGRYDSARLAKMVADSGKESVMLKTVGGGMLKLTTRRGQLMVIDEKGRTATIRIADVQQSNGVIQVVDKVLLPG
jgi:uncharacterized surface protein with fasciclin (FAS1) repeats